MPIRASRRQRSATRRLKPAKRSMLSCRRRRGADALLIYFIQAAAAVATAYDAACQRAIYRLVRQALSSPYILMLNVIGLHTHIRLYIYIRYCILFDITSRVSRISIMAIWQGPICEALLRRTKRLSLLLLSALYK